MARALLVSRLNNRLGIGGNRREGTVIFQSLAGGTSLSELWLSQVPQADLSKFLHQIIHKRENATENKMLFLKAEKKKKTIGKKMRTFGSG